MTLFPVETERLLLRRVSPDDLDAIAAYQGLPEVARYCMWEPRSRQRVEELIPRWMAMDGQGEACEGVQYGIELKSSGELIGDCAITFGDRAARQGHVGYLLSPAHQGRGYVTEAMRAVLAVGFGPLKLHRIYAQCHADNAASWRVMEKLGMVREAHFRHHAIFKGAWDEELVYAILEDDWRAMEGGA